MSPAHPSTCLCYWCDLERMIAKRVQVAPPPPRQDVPPPIPQLDPSRCYWCNVVLHTGPRAYGAGNHGRIHPRAATRDHLYPSINGARFATTVVMACSRCNGARGGLAWDDWACWLLSADGHRFIEHAGLGPWQLARRQRLQKRREERARDDQILRGLAALRHRRKKSA